MDVGMGAWLRMGGGFVAISAFAGAGCACTWRAVSAPVYVALVLFALVLFALVVFVPDDRWRRWLRAERPRERDDREQAPGSRRRGGQGGSVVSLSH